MTLGVRGLVIDARNRVLLVRHTYVEGFYLPGGGVESGETLVEALERELSEEANVLLDAPPELFGMYFNRRFSVRDHVALYVARAFRITSRARPIAKSPRPASSRSTLCQRIRPQGRGRGCPRRWRTRLSHLIGERVMEPAPALKARRSRQP